MAKATPKTTQKSAVKQPWIASYPPEINDTFKIKSVPVYSLLDDAVKNAKQGAYALDFMGKKTTYTELAQATETYAKALRGFGIKKGAKVGLCLPNTPYYVAFYFAILKTGATVVNFNPLYTEAEIKQQIEDSGVKLMVTLDLNLIYPKVLACLNKTPLKSIVVCPFTPLLPSAKKVLFALFKRREMAKIGKNRQIFSLNDFTAEFCAKYAQKTKTFTPAKIDAKKDIAVLQYTGGTTGVPKAAMLSHYNVMANAQQVSAWLGKPDPAGEKMLAVLPFFHVFAMTAIMNMGLRLGAEIILMPRFEIGMLLKTIKRTRPTLFPGVPTLFNAIANFKGIEQWDLTSIRYCISGGASLPEDTRLQFEALTGCRMVEGYGLTESSPVALCNPPHVPNVAGSAGVPLPATAAEIRDLETGKPLPLGTRGEICIKGPQIMLGYYNNAKATKAVLDTKGWLKTGDAGHMDGAGYVFITDRLKDIIIVNGYNVYPRHIEEAVMQHPDVEEVIVIGVADKQKGEVPKAFIKLKNAKKLTEADILAFTKQHLNPLERLEQVEFRDELPKTLVGKLSKKELKQEEAAKAKH